MAHSWTAASSRRRSAAVRRPTSAPMPAKTGTSAARDRSPRSRKARRLALSQSPAAAAAEVAAGSRWSGIPEPAGDGRMGAPHPSSTRTAPAATSAPAMADLVRPWLARRAAG